MCSLILNDKKGSTSVEKVAVIMLLIIFLIVAILILIGVFHFSLFGVGQVVPKLTTEPAICSISYVNFTPAGGKNACCFQITASSGSPGIFYGVYSNSSTVGKLGTYKVGINSFLRNISINSAQGAGLQYFGFVCNTSGSNSSTNGYYYSAGGAAQILVGCANGLSGGSSATIEPLAGNCP
ncbi:MAG: hypothetical protein M1348_01800 [Candidatus Parvarchaeota archaeon]|jgi:hypothetical protein|nr:hypothetical protein [Candidatus Parvarchaeota archaeon]MCL5101325.1 hypothetical protein [Candidatus Parvarchaeota archaeon]